MNTLGSKYWISRVLLAVVGLSFGFAGLAKVLDPEQFLSSLLTYEIFQYAVAVAIALSVPWLELVLAAALISGIFRKGASWLVSLMLLVFVALIVQGRLRGLSLDCGCYGSNVLETDYQYALKIGQNTLLAIALWVGVSMGRIRESKPEEKD